MSQSDFNEFVQNVLSKGKDSNIVEELRNSVRQEAAQSARKGSKTSKSSPSSNPKSTTSESTTGGMTIKLLSYLFKLLFIHLIKVQHLHRVHVPVNRMNY